MPRSLFSIWLKQVYYKGQDKGSNRVYTHTMHVNAKHTHTHTKEQKEHTDDEHQSERKGITVNPGVLRTQCELVIEENSHAGEI